MASNPHPHIAWRDGRPRFQPGRTLRAKGWRGVSLRHKAADGSRSGPWFTRGECVDFSARLVAFLARREDPAPRGKRRKRKGPAVYTVGRLIDDWQKSPRFRRGTPGAYSANTLRDYRQKAGVIEDDGDLWSAPVQSLTRPVLRAYYEHLWATRGLSTAKGVILTLSSALSWAMLIGKVNLPANPAFGLRMRTPEPRVRFATRREIEALIAMADATGQPHLGDMIILGVWSGQRQADRLALQERGEIGNRRAFRQQKTGAIVWVPKAPELEARLEAARARRRAAGIVSGQVILNEATWRPFPADGSAYRKAFRALVRATAKGSQKHGLAPCPSVSTLQDLDLRDTAVTWMALAGATIPEIVSVTGHTIDHATRILRHYLASHPAMADSAIGKMIAWYEADGETEIGL